jgi:sugar porter (SP) family MFS transporter
MAILRNVYITFLFIASGGFLFGYIIGLNSHIVTAGQLLCTEDWKGGTGSWTSSGYRQCYRFNGLDKSIFSSLSFIGAAISSLICYRVADSLGRKIEMQVGAALYFAGAVIAAASPVLWGIYVGIVVYGLGIGFAMHSGPVYIAEISPADVRGRMVCAIEAVVILGILFGFLFGYVFSGEENYGWRLSLLVAALVAPSMGIGISFMPQSPRSSVLKAVRNGGLLGAQDRPMNEARAALTFFRRATTYEEIEEELQSIFSFTSDSVIRCASRARDTFQYPRPLVIGCGIVFLQQITGQPSIFYCITTIFPNIFKDVGFVALGNLAPCALGNLGPCYSFVKLFATLFTVWRVDRYGRRVLLFIGITMMAIALVALGVAFLFQQCSVPGVSIRDCKQSDISLPQEWASVILVALMLYVLGYQVGFGPISWLLVAEIFPLNIRGAALSIAVFVNFSSNVGMVLTQEVLTDYITPSGMLLIYFCFSFVSIFFVRKIVPETKGKSLEEIEADFTSRVMKSGPSDQNVSQSQISRGSSTRSLSSATLNSVMSLS